MACTHLSSATSGLQGTKKLDSNQFNTYCRLQTLDKAHNPLPHLASAELLSSAAPSSLATGCCTLLRLKMLSSLLLVLARSPAAAAASFALPAATGIRAAAPAAVPVLLLSAAAASAARSCCRVGVPVLLLLPMGLPLGVVLAEEVPAALHAAVPAGPAVAAALPGPVLAAVLLPPDGVPRSRTSPLRLRAVLLPAALAAAASRSDLQARHYSSSGSEWPSRTMQGNSTASRIHHTSSPTHWPLPPGLT
jgi:hypothetical protein